jgi:predicted transcriptional regulator
MLPRRPRRTYDTYGKILKRVEKKPDRITNVFKHIGIDYESMSWHTLHLIEKGLLELDRDNTLQLTEGGQECLEAFMTIDQLLTRTYVSSTATKVTRKMWLDYLADSPEDFETGHILDSRPKEEEPTS